MFDDMESSRIWRANRNLVLCIVLAFVGCSSAILTSLTKNEEGNYDYNTSTIPFISESLKFGLSISMIYWFDSFSGVAFSWSAILHYLFLAAIYAFQNNLLFHTLQHVDPGTFQIVMNLRIPVSAVLMRIMLKRSFTSQQLFAMVFLIFGALLSQLDGVSGDRKFRISTTGAVLMGGMITSASFGGVMNELLLKEKSRGSLNWQNAQLYFFGAIFSFGKLRRDLHVTPDNRLGLAAMFSGFTWLTWLAVCNMAFFGLVTSAVYKYSDNIVRSFASALSVFLAALFSWLLLRMEVSYAFFAGLAISSAAILMYTEAVNVTELSERCLLQYRKWIDSSSASPNSSLLGTGGRTRRISSPNEAGTDKIIRMNP